MARYPTRFQQKTLWNAATGVGILVLGALLVGLISLIGQLFSFLQPVLVPLLVAGIIAYLLDPVVRLMERRGMKRLWAVTTVFVLMLITASLLALALMPAVQRMREMVSPKPVNSSETQAAVDSDSPDAHLVPQLARFLHKAKADNARNPIGWALTEIDDAGEAIVPAADVKVDEDKIDFFWKTRAGRMVFESKGTILETGRRWLSTGTSKLLGFLGLVLGMIMVPVYLFFFLKDSASIRDHWHDYVPLKASRFKTELVDTLREINRYLISFFRGQMLVAMKMPMRKP